MYGICEICGEGAIEYDSLFGFRCEKHLIDSYLSKGKEGVYGVDKRR
jgi:hypothetical protein